MENRYLAAIDLGTNSFHIIIVEVLENGTFRPVTREKESVRLGSGAGEVEDITFAAMERGISCLKRFRLLADSKGCSIRAVGTSALREAGNSAVFQQRVREETGIEIEIINGYEEARLIYFGIIQGLPVFAKRILMIDIGGGSTEILVGENGNVLFAKSFKMGAIRLTDRFFKKDKVNAIDIKECRYYIDNLLYPFKKEILALKPEVCIGSSGTIQTIGGMVMGKEAALNGFVFSKTDLVATRQLIEQAETPKKRQKLPGLDAKRSDIILAGAVILEEITEILKIKNIQISEYALREGIVFDTISKSGKKPEHEELSIEKIRQDSIENFIETYKIDREHGFHVRELCIALFAKMQELHKLPFSCRLYLETAALLHEAGMIVSYSGHHQHAYYIISNSEKISGFNNLEINMIALIARYHRKGLPKSKHPGYSLLPKKEQLIVKKLAAILRIADGLDRNHLSSIRIKDVSVTEGKVRITIVTSGDYDPGMEVWSACLKKDLFEDVYGLKVELLVE